MTTPTRDPHIGQSRRRRGRIPAAMTLIWFVTVALVVTSCGGSEHPVAPHRPTGAAFRLQGARPRMTTSERAASPHRPTGAPLRPQRARARATTGAPWSAALLAETVRSQPDARVQAAACQPATAAQRDHAPFGRNPGLVFECQLDVERERLARYDVQVLANGCFVAERHRPGRAIYGCQGHAQG